MASARQIKDSSSWLVKNTSPYKIREWDYAKLSQEESLQFYLQRHGSKDVNGNISSNHINAALKKMTEVTFEEDITLEFLKAESIPDYPAVGDSKQQDLQEIIDGPIELPSWTSWSASVIASPVPSTMGLQFWT